MKDEQTIAMQRCRPLFEMLAGQIAPMDRDLILDAITKIWSDAKAIDAETEHLMRPKINSRVCSAPSLSLKESEGLGVGDYRG